jgi:uncharacterized cupin superfamily protein
MSERFFRFPMDDLGEPVVATPAEDRRVDGNPRQSSWDFERTTDGSVLSGVWESEAGAWTSIKGDSWEFCHILSGLSVIEEEGGTPVTLRAGDTFIMRPGFVGTWKVIEATRKLYVIKNG